MADAHGVYWATQNDLRILAHGTPGVRTLFQGTREVTNATADQDAFYFNSGVDQSYGMGLFRLERDRTEPFTLAGLSTETPWGSWGPYLDAERVYFMNGSGHIASVPKLGGDPVDTAIEAGHLTGFAVDQTHLYWFQGNTDIAKLKRVAKAGGPEEVLASGIKNARIPQVLGDSMLFAADSGLFAVPKTGGCPRALVRHQGYRVAGFAVSSDHVYYQRVRESDQASSILRVPLAGGEAVELVPEGEPSWVPALAVHENRLYWASFEAVYAREL
jgi:hypothetical protein